MKKLAIIMAALFFSCSNEIPDEKFFDFHEFHTRRAAWENLGIDHYRFDVSTNHTSFRNSYAYSRITVFPDRAPEIIIYEQGTDSPRPEPFTIDQRFERIYNFARDLPDGHFILVWYNEQYHFPEITHSGLIIPPGFDGGGFSVTRIMQFEDLRTR